MSIKKIIGRKEFVSIADLNLYNIKAKIDTGADSNSLHCDEISVDENNFVYFKILDEKDKSITQEVIKMPLYKIKKIRSSNGEIQYRPSIRTVVEFGSKKYKTVISLGNRSDMKYQMLIGKKFLSGRFLVDVAQEYIADNNKKEEIWEFMYYQEIKGFIQPGD